MDGSRLPRQDSVAEYIEDSFGSISGLGSLPDYVHTDRLSPLELAVLYRQNDLSRLIVDGVVKESIRAGWTATDGSENELEYEGEEEVKEEIKDALVDARLFGGGGLLIAARDGEGWEEPMNEAAVTEIVNLVSLDRYEIEARPEDYHNDPMDEDFGEPEYYRVQPSSGNRGNVTTRKVHRSRLVAVDGRDLPDRIRRWNNGWGDSVLQSVWNAGDRFHKVEDAISEIVDDFQTDVVEMKGLKEKASSEDTLDKVKKRVQMMEDMSDLSNTTVIDADGESYSKRSSSVSGMGKVWDRFASSVSRASEYPMTKLFGLRPSGFNTDGESSKENWRKNVNGFRENKLRPLVQRVYEVAFPAKDVQISFGEIKELTELQKADLRLKQAKTDKIYVSAGVRTQDQVSESRDRPGGWSSKTVPRPDIYDVPETEREEILHEIRERLDESGQMRLDVYTGAEDSKLPEEVAELDKEAREKWVSIFNKTIREGESEEDAFQIAWSQVDAGN